MKNNKPSIEELEEAVWRIEHKNSCHNVPNEISHAAKALLTLLRGIEEGKWAIVPTEATSDMLWGYKAAVNNPEGYKAAIKAVPQDAILNEIFGGDDEKLQ